MRLPIYLIDAFAAARFTGNPAAVIALEHWLPDELLQAIAAQNNQSETAFFRRVAEHYELRWFTPLTEVSLCGHATLAAGFVVMEYLRADLDRVHFETASGRLDVVRDEAMLALDFPARELDLVPEPAGLAEALNAAPEEVYQTRDDLLVVYADAAQIRSLAPRFHKLARIDARGVIATAPGSGDIDFVSRFFAPRVGVNEDPVTGSAHCSLAPYWAERLGRTTLLGQQLSQRGGLVRCRLHGDGRRVWLEGHAVPYLTGHIEV